MNKSLYPAGKDDEGRRLDRIVRKMFPTLSLAWIYSSIRKGRIRLNGTKVLAAARVKQGDLIHILNSFCKDEELSGVGTGVCRPVGDASDLESMILFKNQNVLALNKPRGLLVHGRNSLADMVSNFLNTSLDYSLAFKPGPVHRLDRNTSGLILFSCSLAGARQLSAILKQGKAEKCYLALLDGEMDKQQTWTDRLFRNQYRKVSRRWAPTQGRHASSEAGKIATTIVFPVTRAREITLALCRPITGRTHQIRIQASLHGYPLLGDRKYGGSGRLNHYILHALSIRLKSKDPELGFRFLYAPLPDESLSAISSLLGRRRAEEDLKRIQSGLGLCPN